MAKRTDFIRHIPKLSSYLSAINYPDELSAAGRSLRLNYFRTSTFSQVHFSSPSSLFIFFFLNFLSQLSQAALLGRRNRLAGGVDHHWGPPHSVTHTHCQQHDTLAIILAYPLDEIIDDHAITHYGEYRVTEFQQLNLVTQLLTPYSSF